MSKRVYHSPEELEMERRWPVAQREIQGLVAHIKDIRLHANPAELPEELAPVKRYDILDGLYQALLDTTPADANRTIVRRMADKIGDYMLWRRETTTPVIHELIVLAPWWVANLPGEVFARLRDIGLAYVLNGLVQPLQGVWHDVLTAPVVFVGHCTCRSSRIVEDLYGEDPDEAYVIADLPTQHKLLDRLLDKYAALQKAHGTAPDTDARYREVLDDLAAARARGDDAYRLHTLLTRTHPFWELLPAIDKYTQTWIRSLHVNRKALQIHRDIAFELANIMYLGKGVIFSSMKLFDTPYCLCCCPSPENAGGCVLTHWYYAAGSETSLLPNLDYHGQRRDEAGRILPCDKFAVRANRPCLGCGCDHAQTDPRGIDTLLAAADCYYAQQPAKE